MGRETGNEYEDLVGKFLQGEASENEILELKTWLADSPQNRKLFDKENELWQQVSICAGIGEEQIESAWNSLALNLGIKAGNKSSVTVIRKINYCILVAAASLALLLAIGSISMWTIEKSSLKKTYLASTVITTRDGEKSHIILPDSSRITMNSGSTLKYNGEYNLKNRTVILNGEAYFDIITNPEKPFIVYTGKMKIIATGTAFNVLSFEDEDRVEATLVNGKVSVEIEGKDQLTLEPGQQVVYSKKSDKIIVSEVFTETYTSWRENMLRLHDTPFEETLRRIARRYNVKFEITNQNLYDLKYTATFIDEPIEEVMEMLKYVSPIDYTIYYLTSATDIIYKKPRIVIGKKRPDL